MLASALPPTPSPPPSPPPNPTPPLPTRAPPSEVHICPRTAGRVRTVSEGPRGGRTAGGCHQATCRPPAAPRPIRCVDAPLARCCRQPERQGTPPPPTGKATPPARARDTAAARRRAARGARPPARPPISPSVLAQTAATARVCRPVGGRGARIQAVAHPFPLPPPAGTAAAAACPRGTRYGLRWRRKRRRAQGGAGGGRIPGGGGVVMSRRWAAAASGSRQLQRERLQLHAAPAGEGAGGGFLAWAPAYLRPARVARRPSCRRSADPRGSCRGWGSHRRPPVKRHLGWGGGGEGGRPGGTWGAPLCRDPPARRPSAAAAPCSGGGASAVLASAGAPAAR